ncbi:ATP-binding cassette domain-containing protein [Variovorax paradoxus]|uniref:ATP-binding cassette domain-containing protein n=1 Tax=Variovorax paradoxus TaxID=34073 RepID=A0A5Q0M7E5_VARPD|nr:ABC transporter ATP-binding protein [Variovorax paradoxus]QFZ85118.1 ATP-binding cassette domain-containing protein [Variovorax paradoxus]
MTCLLEVSGLTAGYGAAQVLFGVDFHLREGQVITLLGRNGMGRSTTIKCLFGLVRARNGSIHFCGERLHALPTHRIGRAGLALVPEGRQIFPSLTVEENLVATARPKRGDARSMWTLARVYDFFPRLSERRRNLGTQLSGGEQQMLAIGRALMTNPRLLVLDEATEGLAPLIRAEIWSALQVLKAEGLSMVVVDKNLNPLLGLADRHFVLEKGRVVWSGDSNELRSDPRVVHEYLGV